MKKRINSLAISRFNCLKCPKILDLKNNIDKNPYFRLMRLHDLTGFWLLILPVWWSIFFATLKFNAGIYYSLIATTGALIMRSAGCIVNDIVDIKFDKHVKRTNRRPLANAEITIKQGLILLGILLLLALGLFFTLPNYPFKILITIIIGITFYPFTKRFTHYAQFVLGFVFNLGVLLMWFAIDPRTNFIPFTLYFASALWTIAYDTVYAFQDIEDDKKLNLKSMAIKLEDRADLVIKNLYNLMLVLLAIVGITRYMNLGFYFILGLIVYYFSPYLKELNLHDKKSCAEFFRLNKLLGLAILLAIIIGML